MPQWMKEVLQSLYEPPWFQDNREVWEQSDPFVEEDPFPCKDHCSLCYSTNVRSQIGGVSFRCYDCGELMLRSVAGGLICAA